MSWFVVAAAIVTLPACASRSGADAVAVLPAESESATSRSTEPALSSANVTSSSPELPGRSVSGLSTQQPSSSEVPSSPAPPSAATPLTCPGEKMSFSLSLSYEMVGQPTPIEAAQSYVIQPWSSVQNVSAEAVWTIRGRDPLGVMVTTNALHLHAVQLPNKTWAIDGGEACGELAAPLPTG